MSSRRTEWRCSFAACRRPAKFANSPRMLFVASMLSVVVGGDAFADTVYDGGAPNQASITFADSDYSYSAAATVATFGGSGVTFNGMSWFGAYSQGMMGSDAFTLSIYADASGNVGTLLDTVSLGGGSRTPGGHLVMGLNRYDYEYNSTFTPISLGAGSYFFALSDTQTPNFGSFWGWEETSGGAQAGGASYASSSGWLPSSSVNLAFELTSTVPLPSGEWLMLSGLGALGAFARRRRTSTGGAAGL